MAKLEGLMPAMKLSCHLRKKHIFIICARYLKAYSPFELMGVAGTDRAKRFSFSPYVKHLEKNIQDSKSVGQKQPSHDQQSYYTHPYFF